jgi:hypothetical protein
MYHSNIGYNALKCDITALPNSQNWSSAILLLNFNLPKNVVTPATATEELKNRLKEIELFLVQNFENLPISYQLSASYWLKNRITQDRYRWVGSFFARNLAAASISGSVFLDFNTQNFVQSVLQMLSNENIVQSLTVNFLNSAWHFDELISVIISCQLLLPVDHNFLIQHELLRQRGRRTQRTHLTLIPFKTVSSNLS